MTHISPAEYAAEMRRLEGMRNEARRLSDRSALLALAQREQSLNRVFWGRQPERR